MWQGRRAQQPQAVCRSDGRQDPAHHASRLQAPAAARVSAAQQEGNPMNWVSQRTTSDYTAVPMTPKQAFEILLNVPEPRRTLTLSDAATVLRVSELLALMWTDLDFADLVMYVRRAYVLGTPFGEDTAGRRATP